jgi:hypothetical protein
MATVIALHLGPYPNNTQSAAQRAATDRIAPPVAPVLDYTVEPNVNAYLQMLAPACGILGWHRLSSSPVGNDTGPWSGLVAHPEISKGAYLIWTESAPGTGKAVKLFGQTEYKINKYFHIVAKADNGTVWHFWYSCFEYSTTSEGARMLSGIPEWIEMPRGAGPTGLGETPTFDGTTWWVRQATHEGARVLRFGVGAVDVNATATAMNDALLAHGYKQADMGLYKSFQSAAGLTADGFPGSNTMQALFDTLAAAGQLPAPVKIYPWLSTGQYDGVNAPTLGEWQPAATPTGPQRTPTVVVTGDAPNYGPIIIGAAVVGGLGLIAYAWHKKKHRR